MKNIAPISDFPGYGLSADGTFWSRRTAAEWTPLRLNRTRLGYDLVRLYRGGKMHTLSAHRLVYSVSVGAIPEGMQINHINGVKHDNRIENLETCSASDNIKHAFRTGLKVARGIDGTNRKNSKLNYALAEEIRSLYASGGVTYRQLGKQFGVANSIICRVVRRTGWHLA